MGKQITVLLAFVLLTALWTTTYLSAKAEDRTIIVPDAYQTISEAIKNANSGDTIFIKSGTYEEKQLTINKPLSIVGEDRETTIINLYPQLHKTEANAIGQYWSYFDDAIVVEADDFTLRAFSINEPEVDDNAAGGAISITGNRTCITNNQLFTKNLAINGSYGNISENRLLGSNGLYVIGAYNRILSNHITVKNLGVHVEGDSCVIDGNTVTESSVNGGIYVSSDRTWIIRNIVSSSSVGLKMGGSENVVCANTVTGNEVGINIDLRVYNYWKGTETVSGEGNAVYANYLANNRVGVEVNRFSENNVTTMFYNNNFINNTHQIATEHSYPYSTAIFDDGQCGNYWSDYMGMDADGDGVGDTPYVIDTNRQDRYPLMAPFDIDSVSVELPEWANASTAEQPQSDIPETNPSPTPLIIIAIAAIITALISTALIVHFKKSAANRRNSNQQT
jgi:nitrous oxidase accessory protein